MCSYPFGGSGTSAALYWKFDSAGRFFASGRPHTARGQREYVLTCQDDTKTSDVVYAIDDVSLSSRACRCAHREPIRTQRKSDRLQLSPTTLRQLSLSYFLLCSPVHCMCYTCDFHISDPYFLTNTTTPPQAVWAYSSGCSLRGPLTCATSMHRSSPC